MNPSIDLFAQTGELVDDGKSRCQLISRDLGGGGINVARNLRRLGIDALAMFPAGGLNGDLFKQMLSQEQLPYHCIDIANETRQNLAVTEKSSSKMLHFVFPGPAMDESEWQDCLQVLAHLQPLPEYLVISGSLPAGVPTDFFGQVAAAAVQQGIKVVLDTSGDALRASMNAGIYLVKINHGEFNDLGYTGAENPKEMLAAMGDMVEKGYTEALIVTLDGEGALMATRSGERLHFRPPPTKVVSHVGAGDSFVSVLVYQLIKGYSLVESFRYGIAAAAVKVQTPGNQLSDMVRVEEVYRKIT